MSRDPSNGSPDGPKSVGAYYTPTTVARALCRWALRRAGDRVLDPAAGDGVFLAEAVLRARALGGSDGDVVGVETRAAAAAAAERRLCAQGGARPHVQVADFLTLQPDAGFDAVVGNPPFVRYQRLPRSVRARASALADSAGVTLDSMASSWAAFVLHGSAFLRPGGRLALVLPSEIGHARYARPVLEHLRRSFRRVTFVLFESALFPALDQGALLLLAEGRGEGGGRFATARLATADALAAGLERLATVPLDAGAMVAGRTRLHHAWLPSGAASLLEWLGTHAATSRLSDWGTASIGYVTGANAFFHLAPDSATRLGIDRRHLTPALFRSAALTGLRLDPTDWTDRSSQGSAGYLLTPSAPHDGALASYLETGASQGIPQRTKVRRRRPWYRVTRIDPPDLALTAMSSGAPRMAVNSAGLAVCNTLHGVRLAPALPAGSATLLALAALSSLTELSAEVEGHALGGGLLKLEPSEAQRLLLPLAPPTAERPPELTPRLARAADRADRALRRGDRQEARAIADDALLQPLEGVEPGGCEALAAAAGRLAALRRGARRRPPAHAGD